MEYPSAQCLNSCDLSPSGHSFSQVSMEEFSLLMVSNMIVVSWDVCVFVRKWPWECSL